MNRAAFLISAVLWVFALGASAQFTPWSAPVNLGPTINSEYMDSCAAISKDGLSLMFASNRHAGNAASGDWDLYLSKRATLDDPWGSPVPLAALNSPASESCPALSLDEHRLYFVSTRPSGCGGSDIYVSRRHSRRDDFGWEPPVNLGCVADGGVNSPQADVTPTFFEDETGAVVMYFASNRSGVSFNIYSSRMRDDGAFEPAVPVAELNTMFAEQGITVRRDGLEVIFGSNRAGGAGDFDLWAATRESTAEEWSAPVNLAPLNSASFDGGRLAMSFDGRELYFRSNRPGGIGSGDLYVATREKLRGKPK